MTEFETMQSDPNKEGYDNYANSLYHSSGCGQYITNLTSQGITHAGIFGVDGSLLAASPNFPSIDNIKDELPKAFSTSPSGIVVNGKKYIFICNQDNFVFLRKGVDGMVILKRNQPYIISVGINQQPQMFQMVVGATTKMVESMKNCGY